MPTAIERNTSWSFQLGLLPDLSLPAGDGHKRSKICQQAVTLAITDFALL